MRWLPVACAFLFIVVPYYSTMGDSAPPFNFFLIWLCYVVLIPLYTRMVHLGYTIEDELPPFNFDLRTVGRYGIFVVVTLVLTFAVEHSSDKSNNGADRFLTVLPSLPYLFILLPGIVLVAAYHFYYFLVGLIATLSRSPDVARTSKRHARTKLTKTQVEQELAAHLESGLQDDRRVQEILNNLGPIDRWFRTIRYKIDARHYARVREIQEAQLTVMEERRKTALGAMELERKRRNR